MPDVMDVGVSGIRPLGEVSMGKTSAQSESLEMRIARRHADEYDEIVAQSDEARDCQDCEACLKLGIQAFDWILGADESYRKGVYEGKCGYDKEIEEALGDLIRRWHQRCGQVLKWARHHVSLGFDVAHLADFERRCKESEAIVESLTEPEGDRIMSEPLILLQDKALEEHGDGQTAEFV